MQEACGRAAVHGNTNVLVYTAEQKKAPTVNVPLMSPSPSFYFI